MLETRKENPLASGRSYRFNLSIDIECIFSVSFLLFFSIRLSGALLAIFRQLGQHAITSNEKIIETDLVRHSPYTASQHLWIPERKMRNEWLRSLIAIAVFALMVHGKRTALSLNSSLSLFLSFTLSLYSQLARGHEYSQLYTYVFL